ncbi:hypothetical protein BO70DRAFT_56988 [Aspergillus heteromorphus CBS 117.55]|uniref:Uncharacterized protein n=1 Tax=Aspergillus heteromorphus CBS 117.55 TaxID=1448321 RepID=A0A317W003_9EURO|nr:uncharacterized protein BO70DRAFT_56988 [Aspergillus heteromorphus CBS 117.55]PWY79229.1 hypothetical protein BO70DRAFT_56988 [Aspergillus heteromorphus CBS 117.55]
MDPKLSARADDLSRPLCPRDGMGWLCCAREVLCHRDILLRPMLVGRYQEGRTIGQLFEKCLVETCKSFLFILSPVSSHVVCANH